MGRLSTWTYDHASPPNSEEWKAVQERWRPTIQGLTKSSLWLDAAEYAMEPGRQPKIFMPASNWLGESIGERKGNFQMFVFFRLVEAARSGLPELYEAVLASVDHEKLVRFDLCYTIPAYSPKEAVDAFEAALFTERPDQLARALGDDMSVRAFAAAACPEHMEKAIAARSRYRPLPREILRELDHAARRFSAVFKRWEGTPELAEARRLRYVKTIERLFHRTEENPSPMGLDLRPARDEEAMEPLKRGRPKKGGRELVVAHLLAWLWQRCGLGDPKLSAQSRFIRACTQVLPWHNIYKADVAQFMRGELAKKRRGDVVID